MLDVHVDAIMQTMMVCGLTQGHQEREDRACQTCHSLGNVEDEQHLLFDCPTDSDITKVAKSRLIIFSKPFCLTNPKWASAFPLSLRHASEIPNIIVG